MSIKLEGGLNGLAISGGFFFAASLSVLAVFMMNDCPVYLRFSMSFIILLIRHNFQLNVLSFLLFILYIPQDDAERN